MAEIAPKVTLPILAYYDERIKDWVATSISTVQADWEETDETSTSYIKNKPEIITSANIEFKRLDEQGSEDNTVDSISVVINGNTISKFFSSHDNIQANTSFIAAEVKTFFDQLETTPTTFDGVAWVDGTDLTEENGPFLVLMTINAAGATEAHVKSMKDALSKYVTELDETDLVKYVNDNVEFRQDAVIPFGSGLYGTSPELGWTLLAAVKGYNLDTVDEFIQSEFGSTSLHTNINSIDRPTIETADGQEQVAYLSDLEDEIFYLSIPIRTLQDQVYDQETILGWFGVESVSELKEKISGDYLPVLKYGITLSTIPHFYKMTVEYMAFETANQIKLVFSGLDTSNDKVSRYEMIINLDGTIVESNSNVKLTITEIAAAASESGGSGSGDSGSAAAANENLTLKINGSEVFSYDGTQEVSTDYTLNATTIPMSSSDSTTVSEKLQFVYNMGDFDTFEDASERACNGGIYDNANYRILLFTVGKETGLIINNVGDYRTEQYLYYDMHRYTRRFNRYDNLVYSAGWVIDDYVSLAEKSLNSNKLFNLTTESTSDEIAEALMPQTTSESTTAITKEDLEQCLEKGMTIRDSYTGATVVVGRDNLLDADGASKYTFTFVNFVMNANNNAWLDPQIRSIIIKITDDGVYSVSREPTGGAILTENYEKLPVAANVSILYNKNSVTYSEATILGWFGCSTLDELKSKIKNSDMIYMTYINSETFAYRIPIQFIELVNNQNQIHIVTIGLDMTDDSVCRYEIRANLDGTVIDGETNNVQVTKSKIELEII